MPDLGRQSLPLVALCDGPPDFALMMARAPDVQDRFANNLFRCLEDCR